MVTRVKLVRTTGTILMIYREEGFGFVSDGQGERFFHASFLSDRKAFARLQPGDSVSYEPLDSIKGPRAVKVRLEVKDE